MRRLAAACVALAGLGSVLAPAASGQATPSHAGVRELSEGRFRVMHFAPDARLARSLLRDALARDTFPGLPMPVAPVLISLAPDDETFRAWVGEGAPEWGAAIAFPRLQRIVLRGRDAGAAEGDPRITLLVQEQREGKASAINLFLQFFVLFFEPGDDLGFRGA